ncbi:hypothetical protein O181_067136 [Austropuccinia psidii MF-1]|uniref:Uncharacterized protein n=1 Tax=Austropuccinia psidii MF-1 TaxID=1389203 RepID=A0A9Q3EZ09_9BASI|nr:hypothetical protein [Austropuccinia psidii MF-1]
MKEFEIKDVGPVDLMLGIKVTHSTDYVSLDPQHFTKCLLEIYGMISCNSVSTPLVPNEHLSPALISEISDFGKLKVNFFSAVVSINYLSNATRPNLLFAVSTLSQYLENPGTPQWKAFLDVLKYLKGTQDLGLTYPRGINVGILASSNNDWGNCRVSQWSVVGFLATRQSTTLCVLTSELLCLGKWCPECNIIRLDNPVPIHEDNQSCINVVKGDCNLNNKLMKNVDIQLHFIKEAVSKTFIKSKYTPTVNMLADILAKSVSRPILTNVLNSLGVLRLGERGDVEHSNTN